MKSQGDGMAAKYRIIAGVYDILFGFLERMIFVDQKKNPRRVLNGRIRDNGRSIIDIGCGTGTQALMVAGSSNRVTGIDISPHMLAVAEKKRMKKGAGNISFHRMNATAIAFPDDSFDAAMTWFSLHEMDHDCLCAALKEANRVLKENAPLYIVDYHHDDGRVKDFFFKIYLRICYPKEVLDFLDIDWMGILSRAGYRPVAVQHCTISKIICAVKRAQVTAAG